MFIWKYLQHSVDEFPKECVDVLIRWFTGNRDGLTLFNVAECVLTLAAYLTGLINKGGDSAPAPDGGVITFGAGPVSGEALPLEANSSSLVALANAVGVSLKLPAAGIRENLVQFFIQQILKAVLDRLQDEEFLRKFIEEIRKQLGL